MSAICVRSICLILALALFSTRALAKEDGQADLDQAIEAKLSAETLEELGDVIEFCQSALDKVLDEENTDFAKKLLAATLHQRATAYSQAIFQGNPGDPRWLQQYPTLLKATLTDLERSLRLDAEQAETHYLLGRMHSLPGGDAKKGIKALDEALRLSGEDDGLKSKVLVSRGSLQSEAADRLADFNQAVESDESNVEALRGRGLARLESGQADEGLADLDKAIELAPEHAGTHEMRGLALASQKKFDKALESLDKAIELSPRSATAYARRGQIRLAQESPKEALHDFDKSLLLQPSNSAVLLLRAGTYQQLGDAKRAMADVETCLEINPNYPPALRARGLLAAGNGNLEEAIPDLEAAIEASPQDGAMLLQLGVIYVGLKDIPKAIETFTKAIEQEPANGLAYQTRADTYLRIGAQAEALADYEQAIKHQPDSSSALNNLAWLLATSPDDALRSGQRAIELAKKACELTDHKEAHILSTLAAAHAESGDFKTAIEWSTQALKMADEADANIKQQLQKELESYQAEKPWRELQTEADLEGTANLPTREDLQDSESLRIE